MTDTHLPIDATVHCTDGKAGFVSTVLLNPIQRAVSHLVVQTSSKTDHIVPLDKVESSEDDDVRLNCTLSELDKMPIFTETHYVKVEDPDYSMLQSGVYQYPYVANVWDEEEPVKAQQAPPGEMAIHRGTKVQATDGVVGELEEFVIDSETGNLTHFILRKGHLWGKRDITIPVSAVELAQGDEVVLKLSKEEIEALPSVKVSRSYFR